MASHERVDHHMVGAGGSLCRFTGAMAFMAFTNSEALARSPLRLSRCRWYSTKNKERDGNGHQCPRLAHGLRSGCSRINGRWRGQSLPGGQDAQAAAIAGEHLQRQIAEFIFARDLSSGDGGGGVGSPSHCPGKPESAARAQGGTWLIRIKTRLERQGKAPWQPMGRRSQNQNDQMS